MIDGEPTKLEIGSCSSEEPGFPAENVLDGEFTSKWRAEGVSATLELALHPPSAISAIVINNAGCAEISIYAIGHASSAGSHLGAAAPRQDFRVVGDTVQLLPFFKLKEANCMVVFRVGRGDGRLSRVATTQTWTHIVLELRGKSPLPPGLAQVAIRRPSREEEPVTASQPLPRAVPICSKHKLKGVISYVKKPGANHGRAFYLCPMTRGDCCGFVAWADPEPVAATSSTPAATAPAATAPAAAAPATAPATAPTTAPAATAPAAPVLTAEQRQRMEESRLRAEQRKYGTKPSLPPKPHLKAATSDPDAASTPPPPPAPPPPAAASCTPCTAAPAPLGTPPVPVCLTAAAGPEKATRPSPVQMQPLAAATKASVRFADPPAAASMPSELPSVAAVDSDAGAMAGPSKRKRTEDDAPPACLRLLVPDTQHAAVSSPLLPHHVALPQPAAEGATTFTVGRGEDVDQQLDSPSFPCMLSREHARFHLDEGQWKIEVCASRLQCPLDTHATHASHLSTALAMQDLGGQNGTWVNGKRVKRKRMVLAHGDKLTLGCNKGRVISEVQYTFELASADAHRSASEHSDTVAEGKVHDASGHENEAGGHETKAEVPSRPLGGTADDLQLSQWDMDF